MAALGMGRLKTQNTFYASKNHSSFEMKFLTEDSVSITESSPPLPPSTHSSFFPHDETGSSSPPQQRGREQQEPNAATAAAELIIYILLPYSVITVKTL